jgi:tRNA (adenine57-N1/adenine58-N1)-methyltransferase
MATRMGALLHRDVEASASDDASALDDAPRSDRVAMGDLVVVYEGFGRQKAVTLVPDGQYQNKYGSFFHRDWVGKRRGSKVYATKGGSGFVWLLAPTPELWTKVLPHRTQILYLPDIALVTHCLELKPGSVVIESGTGSASLTHALVRAVAPHGHVYTFEFNEARAVAAAREIHEHGLSHLCTVTHRDVERNGFPASLAGCCDAAFLDLPGPWKCIPSVARSLRPDGVACSFSPCIEQVQRACEALEKEGFGDAQTVELLGREHDVEARTVRRDVRKAFAVKKKGERGNAKRKRFGGPNGEEAGGGEGGTRDAGADADADAEIVLAHARLATQSHTGYLTFARLTPYVTPEEAEEARAKGAAMRGRGGGGYEYEDELSD